MATILFNQAKGRSWDGVINWTTSSLWVALLKTGSSWTPAVADKFISVGVPTAYAGNEYANSLGYVRKQIASPVVTVDDVGNRALMSAANITWTAISCGAVIGAVVFLRVGADFTTPADDTLISYHDFVVTPNGGDITLQWSTSPAAVFTIT